MLPIIIIVALFVVLYMVSGSRTVKLPAMTPDRRRDILDFRYEEAARSSRIQAVASSEVSYGPLSEAQRETYAATRERMEQFRKAA